MEREKMMQLGEGSLQRDERKRSMWIEVSRAVTASEREETGSSEEEEEEGYAEREKEGEEDINCELEEPEMR